MFSKIGAAPLSYILIVINIFNSVKFFNQEIIDIYQLVNTSKN